MFGKFNIAPNATPEQIARNRRIIEQMMPSGRARYTGEGMADLASGVIGGIAANRMNRAEDRNAQMDRGREAKEAGGDDFVNAVIARANARRPQQFAQDPGALSGGGGDENIAGGMADDLLGAGIPQDMPSPGMLPRGFMVNGAPQVLDPMAVEDAPNGYWDAQRMGNGQGDSFLAIDDRMHPMENGPAGSVQRQTRLPGATVTTDLRGAQTLTGTPFPQGPNVGRPPVTQGATGGYRRPQTPTPQGGGVPAPEQEQYDPNLIMEAGAPEGMGRGMSFDRQPRGNTADEPPKREFRQQAGGQQEVPRFSTDEGRALPSPSATSGLALVRDPNSPAGVRYEVIPGGQAEVEADQRQQQEMLRNRLDAAYGDAFFTNLDRARDMISNTWATTGGLGAALDGIPGTSAHDLSNMILPVQAGLAFDRLQAMRDSSPTGGALGQVSERELSLLQNSVASLELSQSEPQLLQNLELVEDTYNRLIHGPAPAGISLAQWREFHRQNRSQVQSDGSAASQQPAQSGQPQPTHRFNPATGQIEAIQ